jgi:hypothetical protein
MKNDITIPLVKEENLIAALNRRERYSAARDIQAAEFNMAIAKRIAKNEEEHESDQVVDPDPEPSSL